MWQKLLQLTPSARNIFLPVFHYRYHQGVLCRQTRVNTLKSWQHECLIHNLNNRVGESLFETPLNIHAQDIFNNAVTAVLPHNMVKKALVIENNKLIIGENSYPLDRNVHLIAFGKAVIGMVRVAQDVLGDHIVSGIASVPDGIQETFRQEGKHDLLPLINNSVKIMEGAKNNIPDEASHTAAKEIYKLAKSLGKNDIALTFISGGGSALLPAPIPPITLEEMAILTRVLGKSGASIQQVNLVRKNLELLKGGGLAEAISPAQVVSLVLSDVIGDPLDMIASGPTVQDYSTPQQCLDLFKTLKVEIQVPASIRSYLQNQSAKRSNQGLFSQPIERIFQSSQESKVSNACNVIVGSNRIAVGSAFDRAKDLGFLPYVLSIALDGEARDTGVLLSKLAHFICHSIGNKMTHSTNKSLATEELDLIRRGVCKDSMKSIVRLADSACNSGRPICILAAGETTVNVRGRGKGGRNQEMVLSGALHMADTIATDGTSNRFDVQFLSGGTDGQDGPTDAAGAQADPSLIVQAQQHGEDGLLYLLNNDAYTFFSRVNGGQHWVKTGLTGTNVMDLQVLLIRKKP